MKVAILQSNYIPWIGYFDLIRRSDVFVIYDDVQYTKRDWRNRNLIKTPLGLKWLTIPIQSGSKQKIKEVTIADKEWAEKHLRLLWLNYKNAFFFDQIFPWIENIFDQARELEYLSDINLLFLKEISSFLEIPYNFCNSGEFDLTQGKNERLIFICKALEAKTYLSGPAAKAYIDEKLFFDHGLEIEWMTYNGYKKYDQLHSPFNINVSVLDLIFNLGLNAKKYLSE